MTHSPKKVSVPTENLEPAPSPEVVNEQVEATDKAKAKEKNIGRSANILAKRMMRGRILDWGKKRVGE